MSFKNLLISFLSGLIVFFALLPETFAAAKLTRGQTVYVPAYSHVLFGDKANSFNLAVTLIVRSTDLKNPITITEINYFDSEGKLVKKFSGEPVKLNPLASTTIFVPEKDVSGGIGANFIVKWKSENKVNAPVIEALMIGTMSGQGISFVSPGIEIDEGSHP
ncbi:MAG: DUF3124 domain-containing protein [Candidatus Tectomicrobia bacterium]|uniref:DUF3124 domain-containing protein n=1 Tax=Tectimicrobiota bacterium TaxID=2528274 RepID=A0A933GLF7_UNCTE|nr:DUF3124 domain-containing protein [Candidatus Tectomicrobia bacterium]